MELSAVTSVRCCFDFVERWRWTWTNRQARMDVALSSCGRGHNRGTLARALDRSVEQFSQLSRDDLHIGLLQHALVRSRNHRYVHAIFRKGIPTQGVIEIA